jgi:hypothetical protein
MQRAEICCYAALVCDRGNCSGGHMNKTSTTRLALLSSALLLAALAGPAHGAARGTGDLQIPDASGDGRPDIKRMTVEDSPSAAAKVKVRVGNVRNAVNNDLYLFVDPTGERARPSYAFVLGTINSESEYELRDTNGWTVRNQDLGTCGERIRLRTPAPRERLVVFTLPLACFSDDGGAKFAVRTRAFDGDDVVGVPDWSPARRQLSPRFALN